jgi:hypothetical protein
MSGEETVEELIERFEEVLAGTDEDEHVNLIKDFYESGVYVDTLDDENVTELSRLTKEVLKELKEVEGIVVGNDYLLDTFIDDIYFMEDERLLWGYYNIEDFIEELFREYKFVELGSDDLTNLEVEEYLYQEIKRGLRNTIREEYKEKYIDGVGSSPAVDLYEGYFSRWDKGDNEVWIFSYYDERTDKYYYNYKDVDEGFIKYIKTEYKKDRGFLNEIDKSGFQLREMNTELLFTHVQGYRKGIFSRLKKADIVDEILKDALEEK